MISNEQAVVAAVLLDSRVMRFAMEACTPADFEDLRMGEIFRRMVSMFSAGEPVDVLTVSARLSQWDVRGVSAADLHEWISEVPTAQSVNAYGAAVRESAVRRGLREVASALTRDGDPGVMMAGALDRLRSLQVGHLSKRLEARTLEHVLQGSEDYDWVIPELLERGDRVMLTGHEGGGKSTLIRQLAILSAAGVHPWTFFRMPPMRVLVVDAENTEKQWRRQSWKIVQRSRAMGVTDPAASLRLVCSGRIDLTKDADLGQVHQLVDRHKPDLLFIGPLYQLVPRAITNDDDALPLLAALDTLRVRGLAMVIEAHAGHAMGAGGERDMRPRGSSALLGWPEFGLGLRPDKNADQSNRFRLVRWRGDRDERKWPARISRGSLSEFPWVPTVGV